MEHAAATPTQQDHQWLKAMGPGVLFAAAAVGVSHLVQSTRAGAVYGLALVGVVIAANVVKYPAFRLGPAYAVATGTSLLEGYRRQGRWALLLYGLLTLATMFTVQAAVTVVTAGLVMATLGIRTSPVLVSGVLLAVCGALCALGQYRLLDRVTKVLVAVLTVSTLVATAVALPGVDLGTLALFPAPGDMSTADVFFVAALVGWMPSAIDVSVWQSLWTLARARDSGHRPTMAEGMRDFHLGYVGTAILAMCFVLMGAGVMHGRAETFPASAGAFAAQVLQLYTQTLGAWVGPIIGLSAVAVMFSTTLTVVDGFPRALAVLVARWQTPEQAYGDESESLAQRRTYWAAMVLLCGGALLVLGAFLTSLKTMVDLATSLSFLTAPLLSWLNHRAACSPDVPQGARPPQWLLRMSAACVAIQAVFAAAYLVLRYGG